METTNEKAKWSYNRNIKIIWSSSCPPPLPKKTLELRRPTIIVLLTLLRSPATMAESCVRLRDEGIFCSLLCVDLLTWTG